MRGYRDGVQVVKRNTVHATVKKVSQTGCSEKRRSETPKINERQVYAGQTPTTTRTGGGRKKAEQGPEVMYNGTTPNNPRSMKRSKTQLCGEADQQEL